MTRTEFERAKEVEAQISALQEELHATVQENLKVDYGVPTHQVRDMQMASLPSTMPMLEPVEFDWGDRVKKVGGNYQAEGRIVGVILTTQGNVRYTFEFDAFPGMLHIFTGKQLEESVDER